MFFLVADFPALHIQLYYSAPHIVLELDILLDHKLLQGRDLVEFIFVCSFQQTDWLRVAPQSKH